MFLMVQKEKYELHYTFLLDADKPNYEGERVASSGYSNATKV